MPKKQLASNSTPKQKRPAATTKKTTRVVAGKPAKTRKKLRVKQLPVHIWKATTGWLRTRTQTIAHRRAGYLKRRPHRSFRLTRRRDYTRTLRMPGYFAFTLEVGGMLWRHKWTFLWLCALFVALTVAFGLLGSQETYEQLGELFDATEPDGLFEGITGELGRAGLLLLTSLTTGLTSGLTDVQRMTAVFFGLYMWLTIVWLLRNMLTGKQVKLRDGLYNAGAPILPTFLVSLILVIQLIPMALAIIAASAGWRSGFIEEGVISMAAGLALTLIVVASLYWVVSTIFALVIVTLPGMYPFRAIAIAGDLVIGRRLRLLYRIMWLALTVVSWWVVIMIPIILLDIFVKSQFDQIAWVPIVPAMILVMSTFTILWTAAYVYLLYRKVVDDDASPA